MKLTHYEPLSNVAFDGFNRLRPCKKDLNTWDKTLYLNATASIPLAFMSLLFGGACHSSLSTFLWDELGVVSVTK